MKKLILRLFILAIIAVAAYAGYRAVQGLQTKVQAIATTKVRRGDVVVRTYTRGELRSVRTVTLTAPNLAGTVQVTRLAPLGSFAQEKNLIIEYDDSEVQSRIEEKQLQLDQLDEQLKQQEADLAVRNNQDQVELLSDQFAVRRAELQVKQNELLAVIDQKKNELTLEESKRRLKQKESDIESSKAQAEAQLAVLRQNKAKAQLEMAREKARLIQVRTLSPMSGLVAIKQNRGGFMFPGATIPDIREGDQVQPGMAVADIMDISDMEVIARVGELDRANLQEGQEVLFRLDAIAEKTLHGKIKNMSGTASSNPMSFDPAKRFDVIFSVDMKELLTVLGAKPEQIQRMLETAVENRKKNITTAAPSMMTMLAGMQGGLPEGMSAMPSAPGQDGGQQIVMMSPGGQQRGQGMGAGGDQGGQGRRGGQSGSGSQAGADRQKQLQEEMQKILKGRKPSELSDEERQQMTAKVQELMGGGRQRGEGRGRSGDGAQGGGRGGNGQSGGRGDRADRGDRGGRGGAGQGGPGGQPMFGFGGAQFNAKDLENAELPPPPEEDSKLDVLLRPGLLADVEIIVDKIPDALHVPMQAVFEKDGKPIVYVKNGKGEFEARAIKPLKRSESLMVIADGVKVGEVVALADPTRKKDEKKKDKGSGGAMGALPGGKS